MQTFSDKFLSSVNGSLVPVLDEISQIRVLRDYVSHQQTLAQAGGALNMLAPNLARAKKQADDDCAALNQPEDLQKVYNQAYDKLVTGPIQKVTPVIGAASSLAEQLVHVGNFLAMQTGQGQSSYEGGSVSFPTQLQVMQYNELMTGPAKPASAAATGAKQRRRVAALADREPPPLASCCWMGARLTFVLPTGARRRQSQSRRRSSLALVAQRAMVAHISLF